MKALLVSLVLLTPLLLLGAISKPSARRALAEQVVAQVQKQIKPDQKVFIGNFDNGFGLGFTNALQNALSQAGYKTLDRTTLDKTTSYLFLLHDDRFDQRRAQQLGRMTSAAWAIGGSLTEVKQKSLGKTRYLLTVDSKVYQLQSGTLASSRSFSLRQTNVPSPVTFVLLQLGFIVLLRVINWASKGYYVKHLSLVWVAMAGLYTAWYLFA